jgi:hypothetical protein
MNARATEYKALATRDVNSRDAELIAGYVAMLPNPEEELAKLMVIAYGPEDALEKFGLLKDAMDDMKVRAVEAQVAQCERNGWPV